MKTANVAFSWDIHLFLGFKWCILRCLGPININLIVLFIYFVYIYLPVYPPLGYGFMLGYKNSTRTPTPWKPAVLPQGFPYPCYSLLPMSASATKQSFNNSLKSKWMTNWNASPRKLRMTQFGDAFPFSAFLKRLYMLTRKQSSIILQIRCGHFPLNKYLHRINRSDTERCQACEEQHDGAPPPPETVNHFLFDCPAHNIARGELIDTIGINNFHLAEIMLDVDRMKALVKFINRTRRFRE